MLLERSSRPIPDALEQMGGLQNQYALSGYIGLWSRLAHFDRSSLTTALEQRTVVQGTLMRATIHLVSPRDFWAFSAGVRDARRASWMKMVRAEKLPEVSYEVLATSLREQLADGPRRRIDLVADLQRAGYLKRMWDGATLWLDLVRVPPSGTWERRRADVYGLADTWIPSRTRWTEPQGLAHLTRRYLGAFGPAAATDVASWAGVARSAIEPVIRSMRLARYTDQNGNELFDIVGGELPDPDTPAPVRFLPTWEACLLAHARRTGILPEDVRTRVFHTSMPQSVGSFLVDGVVAGTWSWRTDHVEVAPFDRLPKSVQREVDAEAGRLTEFHR
jgi:hypothetical protein